ncbi:unnamed protein product [Paramecium pentaurelia]|uniref:Uncharacterized protein n=1 Tax=Paramecium pentaurelia TaxID=43138 RepID=A0A8S1TRM2_9CILI|nr:unnamed protein product [Paramecium pentaurelia]
MESEAQNALIFLESIQEKGIQEIEIDKWDQLQEKLVKSKIQIKITQDNYILYTQDGVILKSELILDNSKKLEIVTNIDQIKYFQWTGEYGQNNRKLGKWIVTWNMEVLKDVGGKVYGKNQLKIIGGRYSQHNRKNSKAQIYERGVYYNNQRFGTWNFIQDNKRIGGGQYNNQGKKNGKWIELNDRYYNLSQITHQGEYKNDNKVGEWKCYLNYEKYKLIGGGIYHQVQEGSIKIGRWIELSDGFSVGSKITLQGDYNNGKKVGSWNYYWNDNNINKLMGGGLYDDSIKIGRWNELINNFGGGQGQSQIAYAGEYYNDKKIGRWNILYQEYWEKNFQIVGGGLYNDLGSIKIGNWIEVSENFGSRRGQSFVTYHGEYKNNKKVGKWYIWYKQFNNRWDSEQIGGGLYDQEGFFKIGMWIEVGDGFEMNMQIIYRGYYQNDEKVGRWDILYREWGREKFEQIGGGSYSEVGSLKIGKWIELVDGSLVSYICEYKDGKVISIQK